MLFLSLNVLVCNFLHLNPEYNLYSKSAKMSKYIWNTSFNKRLKDIRFKIRNWLNCIIHLYIWNGVFKFSRTIVLTELRGSCMSNVHIPFDWYITKSISGIFMINNIVQILPRWRIIFNTKVRVLPPNLKWNYLLLGYNPPSTQHIWISVHNLQTNTWRFSCW